MDLEQRVKMLEQELQILKNEIQATLLDIQSYLLTNTHSELRTNEPRSEILTQPIKSTKITQFSLNNEDTQDSQSAEMAPMPAVKKVALDEFGVGNPSPNGQRAFDQRSGGASYNQQTRRSQNQNSNMLSQEELETWAKTKLEELGVQRTRELIYLYHDTGRIDYETSEVLVRLVELFGGNSANGAHPGKAVDDFPFDLSRSQSNSRKLREYPSRQTVSTGRPKSSSSGLSSVSSKPKSHMSEEEMRLRKKIAQKKRQQQRAQQRKPANPSPQLKKVDDDDDDGRGIVLRLIAGVQNAGIKGWKRNG